MKKNYYLKKCCGIYCITNKLSGLSYVGQSVDITMRWKHHTTPRKTSGGIKGAIMKHGVENFTFSVLEECKREELNEREAWWIAHLGTLSPSGYNLTSGGGQGTIVSDETKAKLSAASKGKTHSPEAIEKCRAARIGHIPSDETKKKIRTSLKGKTASTEARAKMTATRKGKPLSLEHRERISAGHKGKTQSAEHNAAAVEGKRRAKETRDAEKLSATDVKQP
jgi:group I intron endonuclease